MKFAMSAATVASDGKAVGSVFPKYYKDNISNSKVDFKRWDVFYGPVPIGRFHEDKLQIEDVYGKLKRKISRHK